MQAKSITWALTHHLYRRLCHVGHGTLGQSSKGSDLALRSGFCRQVSGSPQNKWGLILEEIRLTSWYMVNIPLLFTRFHTSQVVDILNLKQIYDLYSVFSFPLSCGSINWRIVKMKVNTFSFLIDISPIKGCMEDHGSYLVINLVTVLQALKKLRAVFL